MAASTWLTCLDLVRPEAEHDAAGGEGQLLKALVLHTGTIYFYVILKKYMKTTSPAWLAGGCRVWAGLPSCRGRASPSRPWSATRRPGWGWRRTGGGRARAGRRCAAAGPGWAGRAPAHSSSAADTQYTDFNFLSLSPRNSLSVDTKYFELRMSIILKYEPLLDILVHIQYFRSI